MPNPNLTRHWTPLHIELMLFYYCRCEPFPRKSGGIDEYTEHLIDAGLIESDLESGSGFSATARGKAFVALLGRTPLPEQVWVDPRDGLVIKA